MKRLVVCLLVLSACALFLTPAHSLAQAAAPATSEQSLQELVKEVRQLRAALQRMSANVYKGQVMLERLKFHREQVTRLELELRDMRDSLSELRGQEIKLKEMIARMDDEVGTGVVSEKERASFKAEFKAVNQRQHQAMMRESQLVTELEAERAKLNDINEKLNALLEREL